MIGLVIALVAGCSESHSADDPDATAAGTDAGRPIPAMDGAIEIDAGPGTAVDSGGIVVIDVDGGASDVDGGGSTTPIDAGPPGVLCGTTTCADPQICCVTFAGMMATPMCTAPADCTGATVTCDGPEDCGSGEACCGMRGTGGGGGGSAACVPEADCGFIRLCHSAADCPAGDMCCPATMGASVCSGFGCFGGP